MKILVVNVNTSESMTEVIADAARRLRLARHRDRRAAAVLRRGGGRLHLRELPVRGRGHGPGPRLRPSRYDAVVLAGFGEHGRDGLQELIEQPVIEICEASAHVAMMIGRAYSVVTTLQRSVPAIEDRLALAGLSERCASVRASGMSTLEVDERPGRARSGRSWTRLARPSSTITPRSSAWAAPGMAGLEEAITTELGVPVIDGVGAAVRLAEAVVGLGLKTSKVSTYAPPDPKQIIAWPLSAALGLRPAAAETAGRGGQVTRTSISRRAGSAAA